jgi:TolB protein
MSYLRTWANHLMMCAALSAAVCGCGSPASSARARASKSQAVGQQAPATQPFQDPRETAVLSDLLQLTSGFDRAGEAYFSPDMKFIIFQASPHGEEHYQMYVAPLRWENGRLAGGGTPTRISPQNSRNTCGFFSPDGQSLLFASTAGKENPDVKEGGYQREGRDYRWAFPAGMEIYKFDGWLQSMQSATNGPIDLAKHPLTDNNFYDAECAFSPDGKWICFSSMRSNDGDIYVMRSDGSHIVQITDAPGYDGGPFFSPDGKRLIYRSDRQKNNLLQIFVADLAFDADGNITGKSAERQLTNDVNVNWCPYWHPDGRHLIYASSREGHANYELFAMRDDGSHTVRITYTPGPDILPVFSPDGKYLMWTCKRSANNTTQIFVAQFHPPAGW